MASAFFLAFRENRREKCSRTESANSGRGGYMRKPRTWKLVLHKETLRQVVGASGQTIGACYTQDLSLCAVCPDTQAICNVTHLTCQTMCPPC